MDQVRVQTYLARCISFYDLRAECRLDFTPAMCVVSLIRDDHRKRMSLPAAATDAQTGEALARLVAAFRENPFAALWEKQP